MVFCPKCGQKIGGVEEIAKKAEEIEEKAEEIVDEAEDTDKEE